LLTALHSLPALENRTLRISPDIAGFEYQYEDETKCIKKILWVCIEHPMAKEYFDLTNLEMRKKLINMGFVARVREQQ
jgi:hypothetical protein